MNNKYIYIVHFERSKDIICSTQEKADKALKDYYDIPDTRFGMVAYDKVHGNRRSVLLYLKRTQDNHLEDTELVYWVRQEINY